jgi:hypothetical protein
MSRYYRIEIDGGPTRLPADVCAGMAARRDKRKSRRSKLVQRRLILAPGLL